MKDSRKKSRRHDKAVKVAYNLLVSFRKLMEEKGQEMKKHRGKYIKREDN